MNKSIYICDDLLHYNTNLKIYMTEVNSKYVLAIRERYNKLELIKEPIADSSNLYKELNDIVENDNKTPIDLLNHFKLHYRVIQTSFNYCLPYAFSSSYISGISEPWLSYEEYKQILSKELESIKQEDQEKEVINIIKKLKSGFKSYIIRFIECHNYFLACKAIKSSHDWKMLSTESIGWTSYNYKIDEDFEILVSTNFGYGWASYFNLTVKYKDIIIAPYTYLIKYYKANMVQICNCTRGYVAERDSWEPAFDFIVDFVNKGKTEPAIFAKQYIMNEVREMVAGLKRIMHNPVEEVQKKVSDIGCNNDIFRRLTYISDMPFSDRDYFDINKKEFGLVYKAEKISTGLDLLESLKKLIIILPEVQNTIDEIKSLNNLVVPEVMPVITSINQEVEILNKAIDNYNEKINAVNEEIKPFQERLSELWLAECKVEKENRKSYSVVQRNFLDENPIYVSLKAKLNDLTEKKRKKVDEKSNRMAILNRLQACVNKINDYLSKAA